MTTVQVTEERLEVAAQSPPTLTVVEQVTKVEPADGTTLVTVQNETRTVEAVPERLVTTEASVQTVEVGVAVSDHALLVNLPFSLSAHSGPLGLLQHGDVSGDSLTKHAFAQIVGTISSAQHGTISSGDPHTQYALLAGRTGTTNNLLLSSTASGTLTGGTGSANRLILKGTTNDPGEGTIELLTTNLDLNYASFKILHQGTQRISFGVGTPFVHIEANGPDTVNYNTLQTTLSYQGGDGPASALPAMSLDVRIFRQGSIANLTNRILTGVRVQSYKDSGGRASFRLFWASPTSTLVGDVWEHTGLYIDNLPAAVDSWGIRIAGGTTGAINAVGVNMTRPVGGTISYGLWVQGAGGGTDNAAIRQDNTTGYNMFAANTRIGGTATPTVALDVTGAALISTTLGVTGATTLSSTLGVTGAATLSSTLAVTGASTLTGAVTSSPTGITATQLTVAPTTTATSALVMADLHLQPQHTAHTSVDFTVFRARLTKSGGTALGRLDGITSLIRTTWDKTSLPRVTDVRHVFVDPPAALTNTSNPPTTHTGVYIGSLAQGVTVYGLYVADITGGTTRHPIYQAGANGTNRFFAPINAASVTCTGMTVTGAGALTVLSNSDAVGVDAQLVEATFTPTLNAAGRSIYGLNFIGTATDGSANSALLVAGVNALFEWGGSGTLTELTGGLYRIGPSHGAGTVTTGRGLHAKLAPAPGGGTNPTTVTTYLGFEAQLVFASAPLTTTDLILFRAGAVSGAAPGGTAITNYYNFKGESITVGTNRFGLAIGDITGGTIARILELGPTPYLRLLGSGNWTATANQTPLYLAEGATPTLRQVQWKAFSDLVAADRVMVLV